jgi:hypothetical protein
MPIPTGFTRERWEIGVAWAWRLARDHGPEALALGWTAQELFGLHPAAPSCRYDGMGLAFLLRPADEVVEVTAHGARVRRATGAEHRFRLGMQARESTPAWLIERG